ncbi:MAG: hypothetical protein ACP5QU_08720 [Anaerolineae bacterium]
MNLRIQQKLNKVLYLPLEVGRQLFYEVFECLHSFVLFRHYTSSSGGIWGGSTLEQGFCVAQLLAVVLHCCASEESERARAGCGPSALEKNIAIRTMRNAVSHFALVFGIFWKLWMR